MGGKHVTQTCGYKTKSSRWAEAFLALADRRLSFCSGFGSCGCAVDSDGLAHLEGWSVDESCRLLLAEAPPPPPSLDSFPYFLSLPLDTVLFPLFPLSRLFRLLSQPLSALSLLAVLFGLFLLCLQSLPCSWLISKLSDCSYTPRDLTGKPHNTRHILVEHGCVDRVVGARHGCRAEVLGRSCYIHYAKHIFV